MQQQTCRNQQDRNPQKRFKFLAKKFTTHVTTEASLLMPHMELASYIAEYQAGKITTKLEFWQQKQLVYPVLASLALVLISMPAADVHSERVFSLCGDFCAQKRNRMSRNLDRSLLKNVQYSFVSIVTEKGRLNSDSISNLITIMRLKNFIYQTNVNLEKLTF